MHRGKLRACIGVAVALLLPASAGAQFVAAGAEFQVNTYTTSVQAPQTTSAIARGSNGSFVVVFGSFGQDGSYGGVFAQQFDSDGFAIGAEFQVNTYTTQTQRRSAVASASDGTFVVVWDSLGQDTPGTGGSGVFGQRYSSSGDPIGGEFQVNSYTTGDQISPSLAIAPDGSTRIVWQSDGQDGSNEGIFSQLYSSTGAQVGTEFQVNSFTDLAQEQPVIASELDGDFVVVWADRLLDMSGYAIVARRFASDGTAQGTETVVNTYTPNDQLRAAIDLAPDGAFTVVWQSGGDGDSWGIRGQQFTSQGTPHGTEFSVNTYTTGMQTNPAIEYDANGDLVVLWSSAGADGASLGVSGQRYQSGGAPIGTEFVVNSYTTGSQTYQSAASSSDGSFVIVWGSNPQDGDSFGTFARRFSIYTFTPTVTSTPTATSTATSTPTPTPTAALAFCPPAPRAGCTTAAKNIVRLQASLTAAKQKMSWKWVGGSVGFADFGDPVIGTTSIALCVYDDDTLGMSAVIPAGGTCDGRDCWSPAGSGGFKYRDKSTTNDGIYKALLKAGSGKAKILVKGRGMNLGLPTLPLSQSTSVRVQVSKNPGSGAECWESSFIPPNKDNTSEKFSDTEG